MRFLLFRAIFLVLIRSGRLVFVKRYNKENGREEELILNEMEEDTTRGETESPIIFMEADGVYLNIQKNRKKAKSQVMEIAELRVRDIMIPRSQIVFIESNQDLDACLNTIIESAHSRFPVIADTDDRDNIEGILHAKDLLKFLREDAEEFELSKLLRPVVIVPESKRVDRMLKDFRSERFHMAIVVDEFGAVSGLVTIEDILEQIVGDIEDEFDEEDVADIRQLSRHTYAVRALTDIDDFNAQFNTHFDDEEVDTIGGLIMQAFGYLPKRGEEIT